MIIHHHIKRTKRLFAVAIICLVLFIIFGSLSFKQNNVITRAVESISRELQTITYKAEYRRSSALAQAEPAPTIVLSTQTEAPASSIPVLLYHGIVKKQDRFSLTKDTFKDQMFAMKRAGYETVTLREAEAFLKDGEPLPHGSFLLSFDDGRYDSYIGADPILKALGYEAVMFVSTKASLEIAANPHNKYYLDQGDLAQMLESGRWEIGSHGIQETGGTVPLDESGNERGNFLSNRSWRADEGRLETLDEYRTRVHREVAESKRLLEERFGIEVLAFSYPFGDWGQQSENVDAAVASSYIAAEVSPRYSMAFRQVWPGDVDESFNYPGKETLHELRRIEVATDLSGEELVALLSAASAKAIPYRDSFERNSGWKSAWGSVSVRDGAIALRATEQTAGAFAFLDGTRGWSDYRFEVAGQWQGGSHVSLIGRYQDRENYAECVFSDNDIRIQQVIDGERHLIKEEKAVEKLPKNNARFAMSVDGTHIGCRSGDSKAVIAYNLAQRLSDGGIGVKIWDQTLGISTLKLHSLEVTSLGTARVLE